jgi:translation elongation factor EF-1beta
MKPFVMRCNGCFDTYTLFLAKLVAVGYGIKKLTITCVVEDDKVGTDDLEEAIVAFEDYVSFTRILHEFV